MYLPKLSAQTQNVGISMRKGFIAIGSSVVHSGACPFYFLYLSCWKNRNINIYVEKGYIIRIFIFERTSCQKIVSRIISCQVNPSWMFHCYLNSMTWKEELSTYSTRASRIFFRLCSQMQTKQRKINTDIVSSSCYQESNASLLDCYDAKCQNGTWK